MKSGGAKANASGQQHENIVQLIAQRHGLETYRYKDWVKQGHPNPAIITRYPYESIYATDGYGDAYILSGRKSIWIEAKRQTVSGSVDEKYPYVFHNMIEEWIHLADKVVVVFDGTGMKDTAVDWIKDQCREYNRMNCHEVVHAMRLHEFIPWLDKTI